MKFSTSFVLLGSLLTTSSALSIAGLSNSVSQAVLGGNQRCLVETAPGETRWIDESEKWELRKVRTRGTSTTRPLNP